jgi:hypothetical protein
VQVRGPEVVLEVYVLLLHRMRYDKVYDRRFLGCLYKSCALCANNPNKRCLDHDNFDECYADNQALKSKCDVDVYVQLFSQTTGRVVNLPGLEIQVHP